MSTVSLPRINRQRERERKSHAIPHGPSGKWRWMDWKENGKDALFYSQIFRTLKLAYEAHGNPHLDATP